MSTEDHLSHYGVKGMKWGVRRDDRGGITVGGRHYDKEKVRKAAIIFGSAFGTAAIAAGSIYAAKYLNSSGSMKITDISVSDSVKKFAQSMVEEPVGIVHAGRGRSKGFTFPGHGGLSNPLTEYDKAGFNTVLASAGGSAFRRYGDRMEKVAARFIDPEGRKDFAGRPIFHEVMLPESLATGVTNPEEAARIAWPLIKDKYDALYNS